MNPWNVAIFSYLYILALTLFVGKIATFSFLIAPIVHKLLEKEQAAKLLRVFFPRYYTFGIVCAILALISGIIFEYSASIDRVKYWTILWAIILISEVVALKVLVPMVEGAREGRIAGDPQATKKWELGHQTSVRLNVLNLILGLVLIGLYVG